MSRLDQNPRFLAMRLLTQMDEDATYSNIGLDQMLSKKDLSSADRALLTTLVYGVLQTKITLDYTMDQVIKRPKKVQVWVRNLLRTAVYQMFNLDRIPDHAIFNETTKIARQYGHQGTAGFVTGVLRQLQRQGQPDFDAIEDEMLQLSVKSSVPEWLIKKMIKDYGHEKAVAILMSIDQAPKASLRLNTIKTEQIENWTEELRQSHPTLQKSVISPVGLTANKGNFAHTPEFSQGIFTMQDESSQLVAPSMQIKPDHHVLDACAAPGGKTSHIADYLDAAVGGLVIACDLYPHKTKLIDDNAKRLGVSDRVQSLTADATKMSSQFKPAYFDRILVDAPCSGLGLMRRKPEIKYNRQPGDFVSLPKIQLQILNEVAPLLKEDGILTYSTCTFSPEENQQVIDAFLSQHPEFKVVPTWTAKDLKTDPYVEIFPDDFGSDGFFIATLMHQ